MLREEKFVLTKSKILRISKVYHYTRFESKIRIADGTTLSLSANWTLTQALSSDLENFEEWSTKNKMYINTEKTEALLVTGKRLQHKLSEETTSLNLCLDGTNIDQLSHHKLLVLIIEKDLSFEARIDELCKKLSKRIGLLRHINPYLEQKH